MATGNNLDSKSQNKTASHTEHFLSQPSSPIPPPPPSSPPPSTPPPIPYYPPQPPPQPIYSWEMFPHIARELIQRKGIGKTVFGVIGILLIIVFALEFPIAGMFAYYASSEGVDFGDTLTLHGTIRTEDNTNLSGATIHIVGTDLYSISDSHGNYKIRNAPTGIWRIKASKTGYGEEAHKVLIHQIYTDRVDFTLEEGEEGGAKEEFNDLWFFFSLAILTVMFSPFIIAGSFYSFKRKRFSVVLVGAILGIFTMSPSIAFPFLLPLFIMGFMGFILSFCALIMIVASRKAFVKSGHAAQKKEAKGQV